LQSVASTLGVELRPLDVSDPGEIERGITAFTQTPNGGLIVTGSSWAFVHRDPAAPAPSVEKSRAAAIARG
jgi:putative ABC transport system substrate-binding protein